MFTVEVRNRQLWGVAECRVAGELTPEELTILKEYLGGQASDGWGEGFEQRPIEVDGGELYVHLWQPDDWSIQTEQERFAPKVAEGLPELCFSTLRTTGQLICIKRGETGYYPSDWDTGDKEGNVELADELNEDLGVTPIQRQASFCKNELTCIHYNGLTHAMIGWNANLYDLNLFAQRLASLTEEQKKGMDALLKIKQNHRVAPIPLNQLINLTYNTDICCFAPRVSNHEELGAFLYANEMLSNEAMALLDTTEEGSGFQERLLELLGEQHQEDHGGVFTDFGYAELGGEIKDIYVCQSNETACFHRSDAPVVLEVRKGFFNDPSYDNDKTAVLNLPAADAGIWRAVEKVDAASVDECAFRCVDCLIPFLRDAINNAMRNSFDQLDEVIAEINSQCEDGKSLDDTRVKAIFYALYFAAEQPDTDGIHEFADCFVDYEERTRTVTTTDEEGNEVETTETYMVAVPIEDLAEIYERISHAIGVEVTADHQANADSIYHLILYGSPSGESGGWFPGADVPFIGVDGFCSPIGAGWESVVTSEFGYRSDPFTGETRGHTGIDLAVPTGTPIWAALPGTVTVSQYNSSYGYYVIIDHGNGLSTLYGHNSRLLAQVGQTVEAGDIISLSGSTGRSTGPHLHFEVRVNGERTNPRYYLPKTGG